MEQSHTLRGLANISFYAADHEAAKKWYTEFLGVEPYFNVPGYTEFRIGDYQHELGIIDSAFAPIGATSAPAGAITYWHVDHLEETLEKLMVMAAIPYQPITDHSGGSGRFVTASVVDPFGNILGIMTNMHYLDIFNQKEI